MDSLLILVQRLCYLGDKCQGEQLLREALKIHQAINNRWYEISTWNELGILYLMIGELDEARTSLDEGLALSRKIANETGQAYILCNLGQVLREQDQLEQAEHALIEGLQLAEAQGDVNLEAIYFSDLAMVSLGAKRFEETTQRASTSLEKFRSLNLILSTTANLTTLAVAHLALNNQSQALSYVHEALKILDDCGGEGPDFPQRDYWMCYQVLKTAGEATLAQSALTSAYRLLMQQAQRISDLKMRKSYLENITFNRSILQAASQPVWDEPK